MRWCGRCGEKLEQTKRFCSSCGHAIQVESAEPANQAEAAALVVKVKNSFLAIDSVPRDEDQAVDDVELEKLYEIASRATLLDAQNSDAFFLKARLAHQTANISNKRLGEMVDLFTTAQDLADPAQRPELRSNAANFLESGASTWMFPNFVHDNEAYLKGLLGHLTSADFVYLATSTIKMFFQAHLWGGKVAPLEKAVVVARVVLACEGSKDRLANKFLIDETTRAFFHTKLYEAALILAEPDSSIQKDSPVKSVSVSRNSFGKAAVWVLGGLAIAILFIAGVIGGGSDGAGAAQVACHNRVESALKAPSTARFTSTVSKHNNREDDFLVEGTVDAENSFGAMVRSSFQCVVDTSGSSPRVTLNYLR